MTRSVNPYRATALAFSFVLAGGALAACPSGGGYSSAPPPPSPAAVAAPSPAVPTDLTGKTVGEAKTELNRAGFSNVVVGGGSGITDNDKVTSAPEQGAPLAPSAPVRLIATPPAAPPVVHNKSGPASSGHSKGSPSSDSRTGTSSTSCDVGSAPKFDDPANPNEITNKDCGYTDSQGNSRSHDPWIDDQLQDAQQRSGRSSSNDSGSDGTGGPGSESTRQYQQCLHTSGCDPAGGN